LPCTVCRMLLIFLTTEQPADPAPSTTSTQATAASLVQQGRIDKALLERADMTAVLP